MNTNYAGFWMRFLAWIIDYIIIYVAQAFIVVPVLGVVGFNFANKIASGQDMAEGDAIAMVMTAVAARDGAPGKWDLYVDGKYNLIMGQPQKAAQGAFSL